MALVMVLPLVRYLQIQTESKLIRLGLYGLMILIGFSIIGSQSRGAFLGGCTIAAFLIWKSRQRLLLSLLVVAFLAVGAFFVPQSWIDPMQRSDGRRVGKECVSPCRYWWSAYP